MFGKGRRREWVFFFLPLIMRTSIYDARKYDIIILISRTIYVSAAAESGTNIGDLQ